MKKTMFSIIILLLLVSLISNITLASLDVWEEEIMKQISDEYPLYYVVEFTEMNSKLCFMEFPDEDEEKELEYILVVANTVEVKKNYSQIYIFQKNGKYLTKVWEGPKIPGKFNNYGVANIKEIGTSSEIIIETSKWTEKGYLHQLWIYTWLKDRTYLYYPQHLDQNKLTSADCFNVDRAPIFIVKSVTENGTFYQYYKLENREAVLEKEERAKEVKLATLNPNADLIEYVLSENKGISTVDVDDLEYDGLYLVSTDQWKSIVQKENGKYKTWYKLDDKFSPMFYLSGYNAEKDLNGDQYLDIILCEGDEYEIYIKYCYILSIKPSGYKLISPMANTGKSQIWTKVTYMDYEKDQNSKELKLVTYIGEPEEDDWTSQTWVWNANLEMFQLE